jgi:tRNA splicing ligase
MARTLHHTARGNTAGGKTEWRQAWLRRELRGLTARDTEEIMVRGLHKFFNIGQLTETKLQALRKLQIDTITEKLDGQMICGVLVGTVVQFWSRERFTEVGKATRRLAVASEGTK